MSDDAYSVDEDLHQASIRRREVLAALAVALLGEPPGEEEQAAVSRLIDEAELPGDLGAELRAQAEAGVPPERVPEEPAFEREASRRLSARLMLLALRRGGGAHLALAERLSPVWDDAVRAGLDKQLGDTAQRSLDEAFMEFVAPPGFLTALLSALREAEDQRRRVGLITPARYRHPLDESATKKLDQAFPFDDLARRLSEAVPERVFRLLNTSSNLRVGPDQLPELYRLYQGCVRRLGIHPEPPLYVARGGFNAYTSGVEEPFVVVHDTLVGLCSDAELEFVLGHELGHIKFDHVLYNMVARLVTIPGALLAAVPVFGPFIAKGLELAMFEWARKAELSCDRAGLLCSQDPQAAWRLMMRMAGAPSAYASQLNVARFLQQYEELEGEWDDMLSSLFYVLSTAERSHPWTIVRAHELASWMEDGAYDRILEECPLDQRTPADAEAAFSALAGAGLRPPEEPRDALRWLAGRVRQAGLPAFIAEAVEQTAEESADAPTQVAVLGARFRRRSALARELAALTPELDVLDTPDLDESPEAFEAVAVPALMRAGAAVGVLSAAQLLSRVEREVLAGVLRHYQGPVALAIGRMDALETDEDAQDVQRRVERFSEGLDNAAIFPLPVHEPPEELARWLRRHVRWEGDEAQGRWRARALAVVGALVRLCEGDELDSVDLNGALRRLGAQLDEEHRAALDAARSELRLGFAELRREAPERLADLDTEARLHEGVAGLIAAAAEIGDRAGRSYLDHLQHALVAFGAAPLADAVEGLTERLSGPGWAQREGEEPRLRRRGPQSNRVIAAAIGTLSVGALLIPGAPAWLALSGLGLGAASLLAGQQAREERERKLAEGHAEDVAAWLDEVEATLDERLEQTAERCRAALAERLELLLRTGGVMIAPEDGKRAVRGAAALVLESLVAAEGGEE
ncbi:MAG: M48 family metalloprotease [Alphaproteobacteria bacterium]|nr:M48 family metalloprotease [Alphaproteobacteria bacterium]MCB9795984.1 M48 family metalloprotease [Alphaproteobacteria bacterium]